MIRIAFLGDIAFLGQFDNSQTRDTKKRVSFLKKELQNYDIVIANLESPLTSLKKTYVCKSMHLKADPCNVELLKYLNISAVSLANNHIADYGKKGIQETIELLEKAGIKWFGVGGKALKLLLNGERLSISGFCCYSTNGTHYGGKNGVNLLTRNNMEKQLKQDKSKGALSIIEVHWGMEHTNYPAYEHIQLMHNLMHKYNGIICGHHPHIVQGIEKINQSVVAYSLGNCLFDTCISQNKKLKVELNEDNRKGFIWSINVAHQRILESEIKGFYIGKEGIEAFDIKKELKEISEPLQNIKDIKQYEAIRQKQFQRVIQNKFGKHDLKWLINRMNYYAIGARIMGAIRKRQYQREAGRFING